MSEERAKVVVLTADEREVATDCMPRWAAEMDAYFYGQPDGVYLDPWRPETRIVSMRVVACEGAE